MDHLSAAESTARWLLNTAERDPDGWWWPMAPSASKELHPGFAWGTVGPPLFFVELAVTTGDLAWLEPAGQVLGWLEDRLEATVAEGFAGCGLHTGVAGWVLFADELARAGGGERADALAERALSAIIDAATSSDAGTHWHDVTEVLWGTSGIACLMLSVGRERRGSEAVELAVAAGDWLLSSAEHVPAGLRWSLGAGVGRPGLEAVRFPNFAHGTAGISFFLARLHEITGEARFLDAALAGTAWVLSTARTDGDTCAAYHHEPDETDVYTLGWCHGPPGLGWLFRQLEVVTGDDAWRTWLRRAASSDRHSGIPERLHPGFWDNVGRCCGSASVAEFFLDLHALEGGDDDLAFARLLVDDLLDRATVDEAGMRWSNIEHTADDPVLPPQTGYLQGASGIGSTLLRMHRHLAGDRWTLRWPHAPVWSAAAT